MTRLCAICVVPFAEATYAPAEVGGPPDVVVSHARVLYVKRQVALCHGAVGVLSLFHISRHASRMWHDEL